MFAQNNEDDALSKYIDLSKTGKYIDIGAGEPILLSNTFMLYRIGWKGLCVEPYPPYKQLWEKERPKDILVTDPISNVEGDAIMASTALEGTWLFDEYATKEKTADFNGYEKYNMHSTTLVKLLEKYPDFYDADFFSLDVELSEAKVLYTADFEKFRPKLMCIENKMRGYDTRNSYEYLILDYYKPVEEFSGNVFYLRKE